jgi:hypothetical protein
MRLLTPIVIIGAQLLWPASGAPRPQSLAATAAPTVTQIHEFAKGSWIDSLAIRPNGRLILAFYDRPEVHTVNPFSPQELPQLVYRFPNATRVTGIAEYAPDKFAVLVGSNANDKDFVALWNLELDMIAGPMVTPISKTGIYGPETLEGLTMLNRNTLLASDPATGTVYKLNLQTGTGEPVVNEPEMTPTISGIRYRAPYLYFTNSINGVFARIPLDENTALPMSSPEIIATKVVGVDNFALAPWAEHEAYLVNYEQNDVLKVDSDAKVSILAQGITAPTAAQFGRLQADRHTLYIVTSGDSSNGAKVHSIRIPVNELEKRCAAEGSVVYEQTQEENVESRVRSKWGFLGK